MVLHVLQQNLFADMQKHEKLNSLSIWNTLAVTLAYKETERRWFQENPWYLQFLLSNYVISFILSESSIKKIKEKRKC